MPTVHLSDRAHHRRRRGRMPKRFLQNIVTPISTRSADGEARPGALLTPQGKILFDFLISRAGDDAFCSTAAPTLADDFVRRLTLYRLRAKVEIAKRDQALVAVAWGDDSTASQADSS